MRIVAVLLAFIPSVTAQVVQNNTTVGSCNQFVNANTGSVTINCTGLDAGTIDELKRMASLLDRLAKRQGDLQLLRTLNERMSEVMSDTQDLKRTAAKTNTALITQEVLADKDAPLRFTAYLQSGNYPPGTTLGGLNWRDEFVDVRLDLANGAALPAENLDFFVGLDTTVFGMGQLSGIPGVVFSGETGNIVPLSLEGTDQNGRPITLPIIPVGPIGAPVYRVFCPKLLSQSTLRLVIASVALNPSTGGQLPQTLLAPKRNPRALRIQGTYEVNIPGSPTRYRFTKTIPLN